MRYRCAFTLIELLVVIAIIALLIGILLPALGTARDSGKALKCLANMRTLGQGVMLYAGDYRGQLPLSSYTTGNGFSPGNWITTLKVYGVIPEVRRCPDDPTDRLTSYITNDYLEPAGAGINRLVLIPRPSATAYAAEAHPNYPVDHLHAFLDGWSVPQDMTGQIDVIRHRDTSNLVYLDGHAAAMPWARVLAEYNAEHDWFNPAKAR